MLKKVDASQLKPGMYIHDLSCDWMTHPFVRNRFLLTSDEEIRKIMDAGIHDVVIDSSKGLDLDHAPTLEETRERTEEALVAIAAPPVIVTRTSLAEELKRAAVIRHQASGLVRTVMQDARLGKAIELDNVSPVVQNITESILRNPGALMGLLRIKTKDDYTFLHSVSVCTLLVAFCRSRGMDAGTTHQAGLGGLLHDTGKALVPDHILNKPGPLTDEEFAIVRKHPRDGYDILVKSPDVSAIALDITLHHHERRDGSGYPDQQGGGAISELAQMAAIVDVYDAITADRCYHKGMPAAEALRKIYEWSKFHFHPAYAQEFMRCVGIYPVGTMVMLESGRLAVVIAPHETNLLAPKVNVFFNTRRNVYIKPETVDLSRPLGFGGGDKIVRPESPQKWQVDPMRFLGVD
ncbi:HD-GYP domain-containing protein [Massilia sp. P8910]|uniref:HD-GYP domain-containing protein n=1 Tax=Massilia antarctica TaxID=2765360 RepID=UPI0006BB72AC|nr:MULTISPECIES: HD-GYP domain-containing protein [Massilia]MCE3607615.1 HD-GYP domain-containing protein [Massilia antarctica]MCY0911961.1 HD-GYP domain-containing protein [Massilia sp. H27-R4]CUI06580.1 HDIG domain protein [Janthinobacterium sp. CG23_2]CUU30366.1 HDIG domain protein [Janthinobacterium sp. CG23_2]